MQRGKNEDTNGDQELTGKMQTRTGSRDSQVWEPHGMTFRKLGKNYKVLGNTYIRKDLQQWLKYTGKVQVIGHRWRQSGTRQPITGDNVTRQEVKLTGATRCWKLQNKTGNPPTPRHTQCCAVVVDDPPLTFSPFSQKCTLK